MEWRQSLEWANYEISDDGQVRRREATKNRAKHSLVSQRDNGRGYLAVSAWNGEKYIHFYVHRMIAHAFIGLPPTDKHEVAHNDGRRFNNLATNIRWATSSENNLDMAKHDVYKLKNSEVISIREKFAQGGITRKELAKEFGVSPTHIGHLILRKHRKTI